MLIVSYQFGSEPPQQAHDLPQVWLRIVIDWRNLTCESFISFLFCNPCFIARQIYADGYFFVYLCYPEKLMFELLAKLVLTAPATINRGAFQPPSTQGLECFPTATPAQCGGGFIPAGRRPGAGMLSYSYSCAVRRRVHSSRQAPRGWNAFLQLLLRAPRGWNAFLQLLLRSAAAGSFQPPGTQGLECFVSRIS